MAPHSSTLAWKIPWMEEPGRLQSMGSQRVGHDWATSLSLFTFMHWRRKWQPTPVFLPGESQGWGSLVGCVYGVAQRWTRLKQLSSSSNLLLNTETVNARFCVGRYNDGDLGAVLLSNSRFLKTSISAVLAYFLIINLELVFWLLEDWTWHYGHSILDLCSKLLKIV